VEQASVGSHAHRVNLPRPTDKPIGQRPRIQIGSAATVPVFEERAVLTCTRRRAAQAFEPGVDL